MKLQFFYRDAWACRIIESSDIWIYDNPDIMHGDLLNTHKCDDWSHVLVEDENGKLTSYVWQKAGWSGTNVGENPHNLQFITEGVREAKGPINV